MMFLCQRAFRVLWMVMLCGLVLAHAEDDPAATFLSAYTDFQNGERLERDGDFAKAVAKYRSAAATLQQVSQKSPDWQPLVVEYRLKKVQEGIQRLQGQVSSLPAENNPLEDLPANPDLPAPPPARSISPEPRYSEPTSPTRPGPRAELQAAQQTISELREKLERSTGQLRGYSTEIDRLKVKLVERDSQISQLGSQLDNLKKDGVKDTTSRDSIRKEFQTEVDGLKKQLAATEADKEVLEEENSHLVAKLEKASAYITESDSIRASLEKERKELAADRDKSTTRVEKSEGELKKALAELSDSRDRIAEVEKLTNQNKELSTKLQSTQKQLDREKENADSKAAAKKLVAESQQKTLEANRVLAENKELVARLSDSELKLQNLELIQKEQASLVSEKEDLSRSLAAKTVELEAANRKLTMQPAAAPSPAPEASPVTNKETEDKLAEAEKKVLEYQKAQEEKETQVKEMQSQVNSVNDRLFAVRADLVARDTRIADLEKQLDATSGDLAKLKLNSSTSADPDQKQAIAENELLRGVILRQIREQARKDQAKRLIDEEIARLKVSSDTLSKELNVLAEPFQLSDDEKKLFRAESPVQLSDGTTPEPTNVELALTASKADTGTNAVMPVPAPPRKVGGIDSLKSENQPLARNAKSAFDQGDTAGAETIYQQIVDAEPNNPYALSQLGAVQFEAGKISAAEVALKRSIELVPDDAFALTILGIVHYRQQKYDDSIRELEKAIVVDPKRAMSYNYLGIVYSERNNLKRAEEMLQKAIEINPDYADAHFNLAIIYASQNPPAKELARRHYQKAILKGAAPDASLEKMMQ